MITLFSYDNVGNFTKQFEIDPKQPVPPNSTPKPPLEGEGYNVWNGKGWELREESNPLPPPPPEPVPQFVRPRQARLILIKYELDDQVDDAIDSIEDPKQRKIAKTEWEYAIQIDRDAQWLSALYDQLGLTEEQVDQMFREASVL